MRLGKRISGSWEDDVHMKPTSAMKKAKPLQQENATLCGIIQSRPQSVVMSV